MLELILLSLGLSCATGVISLIASKAHVASKVIACIGGMAAAAMSFTGGIGALFQSATYVSWAGPMPFTNFTLLLNPLAGLLIAVIAALAFVAWLYGLSYFDEYYDKGIGVIGFFMNLFIASMDLVILADNAFWFLVFFELMSLTSYVLVIIDQTKKSLKGGFLYLIMAHIGFLMIALSFFAMASTTGSLEFEAFRTYEFAPGIATIAFVLAFFGFGAKAGIVPFHSWLPQAHPAAALSTLWANTTSRVFWPTTPLRTSGSSCSAWALGYMAGPRIFHGLPPSGFWPGCTIWLTMPCSRACSSLAPVACCMPPVRETWKCSADLQRLCR